MNKKLIQLLEKSGYPCYRQGSILEGQKYPDSFWTYWNPNNEEIYSDNEPVACIHYYNCFFYTNNPELLEPVIDTTRKNLRNIKFNVNKEQDINSGEPDWVGRFFECNILEIYNN